MTILRVAMRPTYGPAPKVLSDSEDGAVLEAGE